MRIGTTRSLSILSLAMAVLLGAIPASGQSSDQLFPTPVRASEIVGTIKAREIGDARLTTYYYTFEGELGDLFINVQSRNFTGDIDVFVTAGLRPLTKMVMYADQPESETGRVIYLRKPERLMLRVQGRSPGDEEATVRIKFAGSFAASRLEESGAPEVPRVESVTDSNTRVNSVGTILEVIPKAKPSPETPRAETAEAEKSPPDVVKEPTAEEKTANTEVKETKQTDEEPRKVEVVVSDSTVGEKKEEVSKTDAAATRRNRLTRPQTSDKVSDENSADVADPVGTEPATASNRRDRPKKEKVPKVDPMAGIRLVVYFKDGSSIERSMTEVMRFSVEKAILTVISKNGSIGRYNMTEVARVSIE
jgi:hypothetical protein